MAFEPVTNRVGGSCSNILSSKYIEMGRTGRRGFYDHRRDVTSSWGIKWVMVIGNFRGR